MTYSVQIVYPRLIDDEAGDSAMASETLPLAYATVRQAEESGIAEIKRLRSEAKKAAFYKIIDADGDAVDAQGGKLR